MYLNIRLLILLNIIFAKGHRRMVSSVAWAEETVQNCDLFSCGFDRRVFGWSIMLPKDN